jgi:hypothetical protein
MDLKPALEAALNDLINDLQNAKNPFEYLTTLQMIQNIKEHLENLSRYGKHFTLDSILLNFRR